jgi:hypothetical protein
MQARLRRYQFFDVGNLSIEDTFISYKLSKNGGEQPIEISDIVFKTVYDLHLSTCFYTNDDDIRLFKFVLLWKD